MQNVYDILVNFKKNAYEFYEWYKTDDIEHIKIIPSFKVSDECLIDFINYDITVNKDFLKNIYGMCEVFSNRLIKVIDYACIFYNSVDAIAIEFNKEGNVIGKSKLLFDEAMDVVTSKKNTKQTNFDYNIKDKKICKNNCTRKEIKIIDILDRNLDKIYSNKSEDELKYIYFECFDEYENNFEKTYKKLKKHVNDIDLDIINKLKSLFKVLKK